MADSSIGTFFPSRGEGVDSASGPHHMADERLPVHATPAPYSGVPIIPLHGHAATRARLRDAFERGALPASLLFHGPRGVGKQRLALWLGQLLLCEGKG